MSDVWHREKIRGNKANWQREASVEVYESGVVRIQQDGHPVDVVLLTPRQIDRIAAMSLQAREEIP